MSPCSLPRHVLLEGQLAMQRSSRFTLLLCPFATSSSRDALTSAFLVNTAGPQPTNPPRRISVSDGRVPRTDASWRGTLDAGGVALRSEGSDGPAPPDFSKEPEGGRFGRMDYWNEEYRRASAALGLGDGGDDVGSDENGGEGDDDGGGGGGGGVFSWYTGWSDLEPFFSELVPDRSARVLIPGIGNDAAMVDMYDAGYARMTAFDYAPEGVECARKMFGKGRLRTEDVRCGDGDGGVGVDLLVADARSLPFADDSFDAALEKGTLDAVYLSGGADKDLATRHLSMAVSELARVVRPGGIVFSVAAACVHAVQDAFNAGEGTDWKQIRDGSIYITEDGVASNCVDASILAWERIRSPAKQQVSTHK